MPSSDRIVLIAAVAVVGVIVVYAVYTLSGVPGTVASAPSSFSVNGKTYTFTYVATTQQERVDGLMNKEITNTTTMLFAFPTSSPWQFWMKDTNTSLDMIWVNATGNAGRVVYLVTGAAPCLADPCPLYTPTASANYVIEAKAGFAAANDISVGTLVRFG